MTDFRERLYAHYLKGFHEERVKVRGALRDTYYRWMDFKIKPLLSDLAPDARILELGCGVGDFLDYLKSRGFTNAQGVDCSEPQIEVARGRGLDAALDDVFEYLSWVENGTDVVAAIDFIEHLTADELFRLFDALKGTLKPGGRLILQTPNGAGLFASEVVYGDLTHMTIFTPGSLRQVLSAAGFDNIRFIECGPAPINLKGAIKVALWRTVRAFAAAARMTELSEGKDIWTVNMICVAENADRAKPG